MSLYWKSDFANETFTDIPQNCFFTTNSKCRFGNFEFLVCFQTHFIVSVVLKLTGFDEIMATNYDVRTIRRTCARKLDDLVPLNTVHNINARSGIESIGSKTYGEVLMECTNVKVSFSIGALSAKLTLMNSQRIQFSLTQMSGCLKECASILLLHSELPSTISEFVNDAMPNYDKFFAAIPPKCEQN